MSEGPCVFCAIARKEAPASLWYESEDVVAFPDAAPKAPVHILVVPKKHIPTLLDVDPADATLPAMVEAVQQLVRKLDLQRAYQLIVNGGSNQHVKHLHWHVVSPRWRISQIASPPRAG